MPRANRFILPGFVYHLTHRCHNREFLLKFVRDRDAYRDRLRDAVQKHKLSLLDYNITCNHVHLIAYSDDTAQIASVMQAVAGGIAQEYNRRKARSGAFWEGRYHATLVDSGEYLWKCLKYVELNMVRCGVVRHPNEWRWSGHQELMGLQKRNRLLDLEKLMHLLGNPTVESFRRNFEIALKDAIAAGHMSREPKWTDCIAVGSEAFVNRIEPMVRNRQELELVADRGIWTLREDATPYLPHFEAQNRSIAPI